MGLATVFLWAAVSLAADPGLKDLERQFRELPMEARLTGPLFRLHGDETPARLELEVAKVAEGGNGTVARQAPEAAGSVLEPRRWSMFIRAELVFSVNPKPIPKKSPIGTSTLGSALSVPVRGYPVRISWFFLYLKGGDGLDSSGCNRLNIR